MKDCFGHKCSLLTSRRSVGEKHGLERHSHQAPLSFLLHRFPHRSPTNWNGCRERWEEGSANGTQLQFCFLLLIWYRYVATVNCFSLGWNWEACMHVFLVEEFTRSLIVRSLHSLLPALCRGWSLVSIGGLWVCKEMSDLVKGFVFLDIIKCISFLYVGYHWCSHDRILYTGRSSK